MTLEDARGTTALGASGATDVVDVVVLPGHGEQTSIGRERATNPYLLDLQADGAAGRVTRGL